MKPFIPYSLLAAAAVCGMAYGQAFTTPVGYVTETAKAGQFNLVGLTVHGSALASGVFATVTSTTLTSADVDFSAILTAGQVYILEITSGTGLGLIQEISSWNGGELTTPEDISTFVNANETTYSLRRAQTLADVFGPANEAGLLAGAAATADILWLPNAAGSFDQYYFATAQPPFITAGWRRVGGGDTNSANVPIIYADGFIIQRRAVADLELVISGEVKKTATQNVLTSGQFNYLSSVYPVGVTLGNSGLEASATAGTAATADIIWVPDGAGSYVQYYLATAQPPFITAGWRRVGGGDVDQSGAELRSGIIVQRRGSTGSATLTPPPFYSTL